MRETLGCAIGLALGAALTKLADMTGVAIAAALALTLLLIVQGASHEWVKESKGKDEATYR